MKKSSDLDNNYPKKLGNIISIQHMQPVAQLKNIIDSAYNDSTKAKRNTNIDIIKWLAIITMVIDHLRYILPDYQLGLVMVGRLAFILFALALAFNAMQLIDKNKFDSLKKYYLNLILWFVISEAPYQWVAQSGATGSKNIMLTLFLGLTAIMLLNVMKEKYLNYILLVLFLYYCMRINQHIQYGVLGVTLIVVFYLTLKAKDRVYRGIGMVAALVLACLCNMQDMESFFANGGFLNIWIQALLIGSIVGTVLAFALVFDVFETSSLKVKPVGKWGWWFYPVHLTIIGLIGTFFVW